MAQAVSAGARFARTVALLASRLVTHTPMTAVLALAAAVAAAAALPAASLSPGSPTVTRAAYLADESDTGDGDRPSGIGTGGGLSGFDQSDRSPSSGNSFTTNNYDFGRGGGGLFSDLGNRFSSFFDGDSTPTRAGGDNPDLEINAPSTRQTNITNNRTYNNSMNFYGDGPSRGPRMLHGVGWGPSGGHERSSSSAEYSGGLLGGLLKSLLGGGGSKQDMSDEQDAKNKKDKAPGAGGGKGQGDQQSGGMQQLSKLLAMLVDLIQQLASALGIPLDGGSAGGSAGPTGGGGQPPGQGAQLLQQPQQGGGTQQQRQLAGTGSPSTTSGQGNNTMAPVATSQVTKPTG